MTALLNFRTYILSFVELSLDTTHCHTINKLGNLLHIVMDTTPPNSSTPTQLEIAQRNVKHFTATAQMSTKRVSCP